VNVSALLLVVSFIGFILSTKSLSCNGVVLKRAHFLYALAIRMPFCLCKHILNTMLDMRDDHATGLPFACLVTKICLPFVTNISVEPRMRV
jgi:hypothetical protein